MKNKENWKQVLQELREDNAEKQKRGLHFIITSVFIWIGIFIIHSMDMSITIKNLCTLCCSVPLMPLAFAVSKIIKVDFQNKDNPLTTMGIVAALNQMIYMLIVMWVFSTTPDKMVMVYAMITGAHFLPYGWLYQSKAYYVFAVLIPIVILAIGMNRSAGIVAAMMIIIELVLCILLWLEIRKTK